jgi:hypothetical protein
MSYPPPPPCQDWQGQPDPAYGQQGQQPQYGGGYPPPSYGSGQDPYGQPAQTSGKATTSLVLGIASLVLFCIGFILGIPAIIVGLRARKEIRTSQGRVGGDGLALGGIITGAIGTLLGLGALALVIATFALGSSLDEVVDRTCDELAQDNDPSNDCT